MSLTPEADSPEPYHNEEILINQTVDITCDENMPMLKRVLECKKNEYDRRTHEDNEIEGLIWINNQPHSQSIGFMEYKKISCNNDILIFFHGLLKGICKLYQSTYICTDQVTEVYLRSIEKKINKKHKLYFPIYLFHPNRVMDSTKQYQILHMEKYLEIMIKFRKFYALDLLIELRYHLYHLTDEFDNFIKTRQINPNLIANISYILNINILLIDSTRLNQVTETGQVLYGDDKFIKEILKFYNQKNKHIIIIVNEKNNYILFDLLINYNVKKNNYNSIFDCNNLIIRHILCLG